MSDKRDQQRTIMSLSELLEGNTGLRSAKEGFHVPVGQVEHDGTITLGVFVSGTREVR